MIAKPPIEVRDGIPYYWSDSLGKHVTRPFHPTKRRSDVNEEKQQPAGDFEKAYFERGMFAAYAWMLTKRGDQQMSDDVVEHAWANRDAGMGPTECLPTRAYPKLAAVEQPLDGASLREVFDYAARRLAEARDQAHLTREYCLSADRFDEAYMWLVAGETALASQDTAS